MTIALLPHKIKCLPPMTRCLRRMRAPLLPVCIIALASACGGGGSRSTSNSGSTSSGSPTPTSPSPAPAAPAPTPSQWSIDGRVVETLTNLPVGGATIEFPLSLGTVVSDGSGSFHFESTAPPPVRDAAQSYAVTITAPGHLTRTTFLAWSASSSVTLDVIGDRAPFSLAFYRNLVRGGYESPTNLDIVTRWLQVPKFYMRTVDAGGRPIEPEVLESVQGSLRRGMVAWTGGKWSVNTIETGTDVRPLVPGWVNIEYVRDQSASFCGRATVGGIVEVGLMTLNDDRCSCGSIKVPPAVVVHELGHTLGFHHIPPGTGVMSPQFSGNCYSADPTSAEQFHAMTAYQRPQGNADIDIDRTRPLFQLTTSIDN